MQDNINNNLNTNNANASNNNSNFIQSGVQIPTENLSGQIVENKNTLYVKIFAFVFTFIFLFGAIAYFAFFKDKKVTIPANTNNNSFPSLNLGDNRNGETYEGDDNLTGGNGEFGDDFIEGDADSVVHIWPKSIVGYGLISKNVGTSTENHVLFMDKESGNVYKTNYPTLENKRLTNTTLQDIFTASFSKNGDFAAALIGNNSPYKLISSRLSDESDSSFSESEIDQRVFGLLSSKKDNVFYYLKKEESGIVSINSFSPALGKISRLSDIKLSDIFISGESKDNLFMSSKPSSLVPQVTMILNKKNNTLNYISGSNSNKYIANGNVIKESKGLVDISELENYKNKESLFLKSFADKCSDVRGIYLVCGEDDTLSTESVSLDAWYAGKISFTDSLSFLKLSNGEKTNIPVSLVSGEPIDVYNIQSLDDFLTFENKRDDSLWLVDLVGL